MRFVLALVLVAAMSSAVSAQDSILDWYQGYRQQQQVVVESHPKENEPIAAEDVSPTSRPLPPYLAKKYLHGDDYMKWALTWNNYQDERADRAAKTYTYFGSDTITRTSTTQPNQFSRGTTTTTTSVRPRIWTKSVGIPGEIRYNPFVPPRPIHE
jgi:hypothetical protein